MHTVTEKHTVFSTDWFRLVEKKVNNSTEPYYAVESSDSVSILALTGDDKVLLVRQYRPALEQATLELPSGHIEPQETPAAAAARELLEETGYQASALELLGVYFADTGRLSYKVWCYFASGVTPVDPQVHPQELSLEECPREELLKQVDTGALKQALDLAVIFSGINQGKLVLT